MNRADQAPEPTMEELLASIRHIIADAGQGNSPPKEERAAHTAAAGTPGQDGPQTPSAGDDVFELTEELVFPEDQAAPIPEPPAQQIQFDRRPSVEPSKMAVPAPESEGFPAPLRRQASSDRPANSRPARQEARAQGLAPGFLPVWSRRELPSAASQNQAPSSRMQPGPAAAKPQAKNWAEDIQMPIPDQGPVSLMGTGTGKPRLQEPEAGIEGMNAKTGLSAEPRASEPGWDSGSEAAAVAALAQKLARSAMEAMGSQELQNAQDVDFRQLNAESKADVSEKLADAIERESASDANAPLPAMLDEVLRRDFIRQNEAISTSADEERKLETATVDDEPGAAPAMGSNEEIHQTKDSTGMQHSAPAAQAAPGLTEGAAAPSAAAVPAAIQPRVQAPFKGSAPVAAPPLMGQTLEGAVREMLRPLLVQWLNENMPRILENAIREEIAIRGVFPKPE